jgi:hypothetical protein
MPKDKCNVATLCSMHCRRLLSRCRACMFLASAPWRLWRVLPKEEWVCDTLSCLVIIEAPGRLLGTLWVEHAFHGSAEGTADIWPNGVLRPELPPADQANLHGWLDCCVHCCHTRVSGHQDPGANIITRCAGTKSHTYDESWHRIECHNFTI